MTDVQPLQQKPESTADSQAEFERGLHELMRGHLDDCMSFASCSSPRNTEDEDEEGDRLVCRRRRLNREGDDLAESSAARRRHSRSRWAARQAQEMITTIERRNRESELMALSRLHTVSMLDYSFLRESTSPTSRMQGNVERPSTRASSILQMWRELEDEHLLNRARERVRERLRHERSVDTNTDVSTITMSESRAGENQGSVEDASESERDFGSWSHDRLETTHDEHGDRNHSSREQSPDLGDVERERVRQIVRGWMESGINERTSNATRRNDNPRGEWLGETERERVRLVREWVQTASQQRGTRGRREEQIAGLGTQIDQARNGLVVDHEEGQEEHIRRDMLRLRGRQALIDLLVRIERERQRELQGLLEHRAVSDFAHRNRIQSLLRGRFLRSERTVEDERPPSVAANELLQLRQRNTVSGLREGFRSALETIVRQASSNSDTSSSSHGDDSQIDLAQHRASMEVQVRNSDQLQSRTQGNGVNELPDNTINASSEAFSDSATGDQTAIQRGDWLEQVSEDERRELDHWRESPLENVGGHWPENSGNDWRRTARGVAGAQEGQLPGQHVWHEDGSRETLETWSEGPSNPPRTRHGIPLRRANRFHPPDDDNVYSMELRELLSRRSVSTLLRSGFRESLDQLIQTYVERQGRAPVDWDSRNLPTPVVSQRDQVSQREEQNVDETVARRPLPFPPPPVPPPQPLWQQDLHHANWSRPSLHRSELEWEMLNDLRADVAKLQQGMNHMQRLLETCMDTQLELQRSVRQEVSAALNRSTGGQGAETSEDGSRWGHVRLGTCCVCCDNHIDSLLYRCGHMCTCLKCANELVRGGGKCPLCRAPIVEVIRAYSLL